jgi:hypothetical protein
MPQEIVVIGIDLAKTLFQFNAFDADGTPIVRR